MLNFLWTAATVILTILLIFTVGLLVVLAEYWQWQEKKKDDRT